MTNIVLAESQQLPELPNELWMKIFLHLSHSDLQQVRMVCKRWNHLTSLPEYLNKSKLRICKQNVRVIYEFLQANSQQATPLSFENVEVVCARSCKELSSVLQLLGQNVHSFSLYKTTLHDCVRGSILPELRELRMNSLRTYMDLEPTCCSLDLNGFKQLESLELGGCNVNGFMRDLKVRLLRQLCREVTLLKLKRLNLEHTADQEELILHAIGSQASSLTHLTLYFYAQPELDLSMWRSLFTNLRQLRLLKLSGNCKPQWLHAVISSLPQEAPLTFIDLSGMVELTDLLLMRIIEKWPRMQHLELIYCKGLTDMGLSHLLKVKQTLKNLNLSYCHQLNCSGLIEGLVHEENRMLQHLALNDASLMDDKTLQLLAMRLPELRTLSLENCSSAVTDFVLRDIFCYQTKLQKLVLESCFRISDDVIIGNPAGSGIQRLTQLQHLNLRGCRNISNRTLAKALRFPQLRSLKLGYCHKISSAGIEELVSNCPALEKLEISSCLMLDDKAILYIAKGLPRLRSLNLSNCLNLTEKSVKYIGKYCHSLRKLTMCGIDSFEVSEVQMFLQNVRPQLNKIDF